MLIVMRQDTQPSARDDVREWVESRGLRTRSFQAGTDVVLACGGPDIELDRAALADLPGVERIEASPHPLAARAGGSRGKVVLGDGLIAGGRDLLVAAGPCSVESSSGLRDAAWAVRSAGGRLLRAGAYKPRTSPYAFQGLGLKGLEILAEVRAETGMPIVTEVTDPRLVETVAAHADILQVGARSMQNVPLLKELGRIERPVLLKRGLAATLAEFLLAAEYVLAGGNPGVILCERGIRSFDTSTRFTLDLAAVPVLQRETHLPVFVDPSHAAGVRHLVEPLACAAVAGGADGLLVEVHVTPDASWSDSAQALDPVAFDQMMRRLAVFAAAAGRHIPLPQQAGRREVVG
jgi:3-deoxy-7-phosphoheptulonate synthase